MSAPRILVVDDEPAIRRLVCRALERGGYVVIETGDAKAAMIEAQRLPDLVLLDLGLPDRDGLELIPLIKPLGLAVIVLTARDDSGEKVAALDLGADDYITKPFDTEELLARVRTSLRHQSAAIGQRSRLVIGEIEIDVDAHLVRRAGAELHFTPKEFDLLAELARHAGRVLTHSHLLGTVWGKAHLEDVEYLRVAIRALRLKLEADPARPSLIRNEPGVGYRMLAEH
ncbi:response regulator [Sphingobium boeckii]|uniref:Two-component system KDP operon response regulator KdpE n=1 Tax=Sphingobium boeckii TaxID=1082345 RepID=A0A7W9EEE7_9SPHN|nr:response regulator transcription factor [Sphingobium boeckii]MBB5684606.1 two-component system KDP operon response regulator KdpE [Sphingobium boeckii]